jgi:hypothetical protein
MCCVQDPHPSMIQFMVSDDQFACEKKARKLEEKFNEMKVAYSASRDREANLV